MSHRNKCNPCETSKPVCHKKKCPPVCEPKCKKRCSSSSSSSSSCEEKKCCIPKIVYQACINGGVASLSVVVTAPATYTCPSLCQKLPLTISVTNTGNVSIKSPVYIFSNFTGVKKISCKRLQPGEIIIVTVYGKVSSCYCTPGANISFSLVAYSYLLHNALILVSSPVGVVINQA